ncbi:MAG: glycosyltransferase family 39 protein [Deltaproteobacteria bacterium]|nr:glycosyltransferase family 39 protein [Deltaproteobacteria bacterium]
MRRLEHQSGVSPAAGLSNLSSVEMPAPTWGAGAVLSPFRDLGDLLQGLPTRKVGIALTACVIAQFLLIINGSWTATPDSALYLSLARSLASGRGYMFNGEPHTLVPPGFAAVLAGASALFGESFLTYRCLMAALGFLTAFAGYLLVRRLCGKSAALLVGGAFALNHALLENSALTLSDVPFALSCLMGLHVALWAADTSPCLPAALIAGLVLGVSPLLRINGLAVPIAAVFFLWSAWKGLSLSRRIFLSVAVLVCAYAPWIMWEWWKSAFPASFGEGTYYGAVAGRNLGTQISVILMALWGYAPETFYAVTGVTMRTGFVELIVPAVILLGLVEAFRRGDRLLTPFVALQYAGLSLSSAGSRYLIMAIPALYILLALGIVRIIRGLNSRGLTGVSARPVLVVVFSALILLNVGHNFVTVYHVRAALEFGGPESQRSLPFFSAARWLKENAPNAPVLSTHPRIIHYLSGNRTIPLSRAGVPETLTWVQSGDDIRHLITERQPGFVFADTKNPHLYPHAVKGLGDLSLQLQEIQGIDPSARYRLFRIIYPADSRKGEAK